MKPVIVAISFAISLTIGACSRAHDSPRSEKSPAAESADNINYVQRIQDNHFKYVPTGKGPFPTIIAVPGCSGIALPDPDKEANLPNLEEDDRLFRRHYPRMAERLRAEGYAVLLIHVHGAEGLIKACGGEIGAKRVAEYIDASVSWAKRLEFVDKARIHVIGWSMGGGGALEWLSSTGNESESVQSVVAVYPPCASKKPLKNRIPLLMLLGGADDIAEPADCEDLVVASGPNPMITAKLYTDARHGFDIEDAPTELDIGNGKTIGYQEKAAEGTWQEILSFMSRSEK